MPELPEVEIVKKSLKKNTKGKKILNVIVKNRNLRFYVENGFEKIVKNKKIKDIVRYAKYLIIKLENKVCIIIHLGMTGTFHILKNNKFKNTNLSFYHSKNLPTKHNHIEFIFKYFRIIYNDPRRFGYFKILSNENKLNFFFNEIGLEPFDKNFNLKYLKNNMLNRKKCIKTILLDQKIVSGIGNIYANEILFYSKINPKKNGRSLKISELKKILKYSKKILQKAISKGGSSIRDFKSINGKKGIFQDNFKVYNKVNSNCPRYNCKNKIIKINISNRSTFYCKNCQK